VLQVPVALRTVHELPLPRWLEGAVQLPAHARGLAAPEDPDGGFDRRRRRRARLLARPARPQAHLLLLRLPRSAPRRDRRADAPRGRRGLPPPGREGRAAAAARHRTPGLTTTDVLLTGGHLVDGRVVDVEVNSDTGTIGRVGPDLSVTPDAPTVDVG